MNDDDSFTHQHLIDAINLVVPRFYYLTSKHIIPGEIYRIAPNITEDHPVYLMHPDDLPAFQYAVAHLVGKCIDQRAEWELENLKVAEESKVKRERFTYLYRCGMPNRIYGIWPPEEPYSES